MSENLENELVSVKEQRPFGVTAEYHVDAYQCKQGPYREYDNFNGEETGTYKDNEKDGPFIIKDNGKEIHGTYAHGKWIGPVCRYEQQKLVEKTIYINGHPCGATRKWNVQGSLVRLGRYDRELCFTGVRVSYHANQVPRNITFYRKDQPLGLDVWFDDRGVLVQMERYNHEGRKTALTEEDQAIINLAKLFTYKTTPAYTISTEKQRQAVKDFQTKFAKSAFLQVFGLQTKKAKESETLLQETLLQNVQPTLICSYGKIKEPKKVEPTTIAHPFFYWMPLFNRLAYVHD